MVSLDELVLDMRDIMELSYVFHLEKEKHLLKTIYDLLKNKLEKFYEECFLADMDVLNDSLFYAASLIKAYEDDKVLKNMATDIKDYIRAVKRDLNVSNNEIIIK